MSLICLLREIYYQFKYLVKISGHNYIQIENDLICKDCGHISRTI
jgi:hypothetical protein